MRTKRTRRAALLALAAAPLAATAAACPLQNGLVDFNCDGRTKIVFTGDSITAGVGDSRRRKRGYPGRIAERLSGVNVANLGVSGIQSFRLLAEIKQSLNTTRSRSWKRKLRRADIVIVAVGVNDFFRGLTPAQTVANIRRIVKFLKQRLRRLDGSSPLVAVATLTPNARSFQRPFVDEVNRLLIRGRSSRQPVWVRFEELGTGILTGDGLHPSGSGYDTMADVVEEYITGRAQTQSTEQRPDADGDGVYDLFERIRFGTNETLADTDGDGASDGEEIFVDLTDPLVP